MRHLLFMKIDEDVATLREEVAKLRLQLTMTRRQLGLWDDDEEEDKSEYLSMDAEVIGIRNKKENIPLMMKAHEDRASLWMNDSNHVARALLEVGDEGAFFQIRNAKGNVVVSIGEGPDGSGMIYVCDAEGNGRAGLKVSALGGTLSAQSAKGKVEACLVAGEKGGTILVADAEGRQLAKMVADDRGGTVVIMEKTGSKMAYMTSAMQGGVVSVLSEHGDPAVSVASDENGGALVFYDSNGKARSSLP